MSILAERLTAHVLAGPPARDPVAVAQRLLAIQAQDMRGARLAVRARSDGLSVADVDRALTEHRSLLVTWLNRGTLHLVRSEDYPWLQALTTPRLRTANARRLAQEGVASDGVERGIAVIERALAGASPLDRDRLRDRVAPLPGRARTSGRARPCAMVFAAARRTRGARGDRVEVAGARRRTRRAQTPGSDRAAPKATIAGILRARITGLEVA